MTGTAERSGSVASGGVTLVYRAFGTGGRTPILVLHGTNYYDSLDWVDVAAKLAADREVAAPDRRGFGRSGWSPTKDYSLDAILGDIRAVIAALGWRRPIVLGHSGAGRHAVAFAASFPDELSRLVVVDSAFGREEGAGGKRQPTGNPPLTFPSVEAAMAHFAKLSNPPRVARDRSRALEALTTIDGGFALKRDPDHQSPGPAGEPPAAPRASADVWANLARIKCPALVVRGLRSDRYPPEILARIKSTRPDFAWAEVDSEHDVPYQAPDALVAAVRAFIGDN